MCASTVNFINLSVKLSGIGDPIQLALNKIVPIANLPGVGANLQDRIENVVVSTPLSVYGTLQTDLSPF